jgi:serine/threonine protein phosphatase PrpC
VFISRVDGMLAVSRAFGDIWFKMPITSAAADRKVISRTSQKNIRLPRFSSQFTFFQVSVVPEFQVHDLSPDDIVLMACDGIYEAEIFTRESVVDWITSKMESFQDVAVICGLLLNECLSRGT